jgi:hypothetical protein
MFIVWPGPRVLRLYPFRFRDRLTGKWVRARYVAERNEIAARYTEWEITGPPEVREIRPSEGYFSPHGPRRSSVDNLGPVIGIAGWRVTLRRRVVIVGVAA